MWTLRRLLSDLSHTPDRHRRSSPRLRLLAACGLLLAVSACGERAPAVPAAPTRDLSLTGLWEGALPLRLPAGDWTSARLALTHAGAALAGQIISRDDERYGLIGLAGNESATLDVQGLPGTSTCDRVTLRITEYRFEGDRIGALVGRATGRCFGTIDGTFQLQRVI